MDWSERPHGSTSRSAPQAERSTTAATVTGKVWVNGEPRDPAAWHVSAQDRGFTLSDGLFETMRVRRGRVFRVERHLARLRDGLLALGIPAPSQLRTWLSRAVDEAVAEDSALRLTVTRGLGASGLAPSANVTPTVIVSVSPMPVFPPSTYEAGLHAHLASGRRNERAMTAGMKTLAYTDAVMALLEARRTGADEALFLDTEEHLSEASASNLFVWTGETLLTPPLSCAALPGVTRAAILELASVLRLDVSDRPFGLEHLQAAPEAFLTSSLRGVAPLVRLDGRPIGSGVPGPVTRRVSDAYAALIERECAG
jgi:branched-chain amino acid aminotransferase